MDHGLSTIDQNRYLCHMWYNILSLIVGGSLGILGRYGVLHWMGNQQWLGFPASTFTVNMVGSLLIGFLWGWLDVPQVPETLKNFLFVGFLGGFTTFSSFAIEMMQRIQVGDIKSALLYALLSNVLGVLFAFGGLWLGARLHA
jgi:CrcB protein